MPQFQTQLQLLIQELPNKLKKSKKSAKEALDEILKIFSSKDTTPKIKTYIGLYTFSRISTNFQQTPDNFDLYFECLVKFVPSLSSVDYKKLISYIYNFIAIGVGADNENSKLLFRKFIPTLPEIDLEEVEDTKLVDYLASIQMLYLQLILINAKPEELKYSLNQLSLIYDILYEKFQDKIIDISLKLFKYESYVKLLYNNLEHSKEFLHHYMIVIKGSRIEMESLDDHYMDLTKVLINLIKYDKLSVKDTFSAIFANCLACLFKNYEFYQYPLVCYYYLLKTESKKYILSETLKKFQKLLNFNETEKIWFVDGVITFSQILIQSVLEIDHLKDTDFLSIFQIIKSLLKNYKIISIPKTKKQCQCNHENEHGITNLTVYSLDLLKKCIQLNVHNSEIVENINDFLKTILNYKEINCKFLKIHIDNILFKTYNVLISCENFKNFNKNYGSLIHILINIRTKEISSIRILKILKEIHINDKNVQTLLEISALLAGNIADDNTSKCIEQSIINFIQYSLQMDGNKGLDSNSPKLIVYLLVDIIKTTSLPETLRLTKLNEEYLMQKQLEVALKYNLLSQQQAENLTVNVLRTSKTNDVFQTLQLLGNLKKIQSKELLLHLNQIKVEYSNKILTNLPEEQKLKNSLILAILYKVEALQEFDKLKRNSVQKITVFSEEILAEMNLKEFEHLLITNELIAINLAEKSFTYYEKFYNTLKESSLNINWISVYDDCSILARHLHLRRYYELSFNLWMLVYKFAKLQSCAENQIRAVSYFCENYNTIKEFNTNLKLNEKIENVIEKLLEQFNQINDLSPRRQNYVLICMLNVALFYLHENSLKSFFFLKQLVLKKINNMESRKNSFELVKAKYYALEFELCNKIKIHPKGLSQMNLVINILNEICHIQHITSEDTINVTTFLFEFVMDVTHYFISISASTRVLPKLMVLFILAFENGLVNRMAAVLSLWAIVNLQNELHLHCQPKFLVLNYLLQICTNIQTSIAENIINKSKYIDGSPIMVTTDDLLLAVEPTRRQQTQSLSPQFYKMPVAAYNTDLYSYLLLLIHNEKCDCDFCKYPIIKFSLFKVGFIYARTFYYSDSRLVAQQFYEKSLEWLLKDKQTNAFHSHRYELILMSIYCLNNLRVNEFSKTLKTKCDHLIDMLSNNNLESLEFAYYWQIIEQKLAIDYTCNTTLAENSSNISQIPSVTVSKRRLKYNELVVVNNILNENKESFNIGIGNNLKEIKEMQPLSGKKIEKDCELKNCKKFSKDPTKKTQSKQILKKSTETKSIKEKPNRKIPKIEKENCDKMNNKCVVIASPVITTKPKSNLYRLDNKFENSDIKASSSRNKIKSVIQSSSSDKDNIPKRTLRNRKALN